MAAASDLAELSTVRTQLDDLLARVVAIADRYRETEDSGIAGDLDGVERAIVTAGRTLDRARAALGSIA